jgi:hypothetical protein
LCHSCTTEIEIEGRLIEQLMKAALQRKWESIGRHALPVLSAAPSGGRATYDRLLQAIGDAPVVMVHSTHLDRLEARATGLTSCRWAQIGEASHGTLDFYRERAIITRRLIEEKGFSSVIVEADWPDAYRINRYVKRLSSSLLASPDVHACVHVLLLSRFVQHYPTTKDQTAQDALGDFERFPKWFARSPT